MNRLLVIANQLADRSHLDLARRLRAIASRATVMHHIRQDDLGSFSSGISEALNALTRSSFETPVEDRGSYRMSGRTSVGNPYQYQYRWLNYNEGDGYVHFGVAVKTPDGKQVEDMRVFGEDDDANTFAQYLASFLPDEERRG